MVEIVLVLAISCFLFAGYLHREKPSSLIWLVGLALFAFAHLWPLIENDVK